jgi:hypothetical protein
MGPYLQQLAHQSSVYCSRNPTTNSLGISSAILRSSSANVMPIVDVVMAIGAVLTATNNYDNLR